MLPYNKPFQNKPHYDPGRFRYTLVFKLQTSVSDGAGGTVPSKGVVKELKAIRLPIRPTDELAMQAGASIMKESCYFVIRKSETFAPRKDMNFSVGEDQYVIKGLIPEGEPVKYIRILSSKKDG